ncbi:hypothetical protein [Sphaerisporangium album]|uniref:hypothetical protein n=1 Tax=Sphaerisporangium album TaxID=509200 RepID=UPI0011C04043|nr:hypothetical protein [Sphaerisporangium album]
MQAVREGDLNRVDSLAEELWLAARRGGMNDLAIDLWDAREIGEQALMFAIENNGVADPRQ